MYTPYTYMYGYNVTILLREITAQHFFYHVDIRTSDVVVSEQGVFPCVAAVPSHVPELVPALSEAESNRVTDDQQ